MAWLGFELTTSILEGESADHGSLHGVLIFFKCHMIKMITFVLCNSESGIVNSFYKFIRLFLGEFEDT